MADHPHATADERRTRVTSAEGRQATGARDRFAVLTASLMLAALAGSAVLAYFLA